MISTKIRPAAKQTINANSIRAGAPAPGASTSDTRMPSLAASSPPVVPGSTNLLRTMCCRITPHTARPTPVSTSAARRGRRLAVSVSQASPDNDNNCPHSSCRAPTSSDAPHKMANHHSQRAGIRLARCSTARRSASLWQPDAVPENAHNARHWRAMPQACPAQPVGLCRAPQSGLPSTP